MSDRFRITAALRTPVIITSYGTLDGLLAAILFDNLGDVDAAHAQVPLVSTDGLFHASAARLINASREVPVGFIAGLRTDHDLPLGVVARNKAGDGPHTKPGPKRRREFGNVSNNYFAWAATAIEWTAEGDGDAVFDLLQEVTSIGKRRGSGWGDVMGWHIELANDNGVVDDMGSVLRPVPVGVLGESNAIVADAAWKPAYRAICYVPSPESRGFLRLKPEETAMTTTS